MEYVGADVIQEIQVTVRKVCLKSPFKKNLGTSSQMLLLWLRFLTLPPFRSQIFIPFLSAEQQTEEGWCFSPYLVAEGTGHSSWPWEPPTKAIPSGDKTVLQRHSLNWSLLAQMDCTSHLKRVLSTGLPSHRRFPSSIDDTVIPSQLD